jgi:exodeoxyribonuclease VII large subunit
MHDRVVGVWYFLQAVQELLQGAVVAIQGEVANVSVRRGYTFFDLKDESQDARLSCLCFRGDLSHILQDGQLVIVRGKPTIYIKSGQFRLLVQYAEPLGQGSVQRAFMALQKRLEAEGLFQGSRKRAIQPMPQSVGLITSRNAAGMQDFLAIAQQLVCTANFYHIDVAVQGEKAESEICEALARCSQMQLDCVVLIRGGGSTEDLHAYNSEKVARAIASSRVPVLVGVGHQQDITIAGMVADVEVATPTAAAHHLFPTVGAFQAQVFQLLQRMRVTGEQRIGDAMRQVDGQMDRLQRDLMVQVQHAQQHLDGVMKHVGALSPLAVLQRGYSITSWPGKVPKQPPGQGAVIETRMSDMLFQSVVNSHE